MAEGFKARNLSVLAYANGFTLWHYITPDVAADVDTADYFADARDMLRVGDFIIANTNRDATLSGGLFVVASSGAGGVDVRDMTAVGTSNTD
ncbi:hypothetical protein HED22_15005 [Thalassospira sp. HF15]|uniref:hypothetical protein n=1 Tax=Thalassospira sp. HF15 TaxID=2722755 RepID=UPI0014300A52|nr:hypothetical protein [Thalassospira sp. HF15]NIY76961.1 hypothetical protein [Thalassospira sp. HF15]